MKSIVISCILSFITISITAQIYDVSTCEELGLRPITPEVEGEGPKDLLWNYYEPDENGVGGLGCWAYHHPNGKDYVVTPHSWGNPANTPHRKELIEDAMAAITAARGFYPEYGTLDNTLYFVLNDVDHGAETAHAEWLVGNECWMFAGVPNLEGLSSAERRYDFAHEVGHCFIMENVDNLGKKFSLNHWMDESVSEHLASELYNRIDREFLSADDFNFNTSFRQPYNAYSLFTYYVRENGKRNLVPLLNKLTSVYRLDQRLHVMRELDFDELFHNYTFDYSQNKLKDSGSSLLIPKIRSYEINETLELDPAATEAELSEVDGLHFESVELRIPAGFDAVVRPAVGSDKRFYQSVLIEGADDIRNWESEINVTGNCTQETSLLVILTHLNISDIRNLKVPYELRAKTNCCSEEGETMDGCLIGTWEVDVSTISHYIDYDVRGNLKVTFENYPTGQLNAEFDLQFNFDNGDYDTHKGTLSACVLPLGTEGHLNYFELSGVSLGRGNIHTHFYSRRSEMLDLTEDVLEGLNGFKFNYTSCEPDLLTILYLITMQRVN